MLKEEFQKEIIIELIHPNEAGKFLIKNKEILSNSVLKLLQISKGCGKNLRISILSTIDTNIPFKRKRKYKYDDEYKLAVTVEDDSSIDINYNVLARMETAAECIEDREENRDKTKIIVGLNESIPTIVLSEEIASEYCLNTSERDKLVQVETKVPETNGKSYKGYVICPEYIKGFIRILQNRWKN